VLLHAHASTAVGFNIAHMRLFSESQRGNQSHVNDRGEFTMTASMSRPPEVDIDSEATSRSGWYACAAILLAIVGAFNILHGYVALENSEFLVSQYVYDNLDFWGWAFLIWGGLQVLAGIVTLASTTSTFGPLLGTMLATVGAVMWFFMIFAAPTAALIGIVVNLVIIYGLVAKSPGALGYD
jgi:hypothetical protein